MTSIEKLRLWFRDPIKKLSGDDAFVCLSISMSLFERYIYALLNESGGQADKAAFEAKAADVLNIDPNVFNKFWGMYRVGLQHYLQPKIFESGGIKYRWEIERGAGAKPTMDKTDSDTCVVRVDPWDWFDLVFGFWETRPELLDRLKDFPIAEIY